MDYDLQRALQGLSRSAPVPDEPVGPEAVMTRVRRGRTVRAALTATVGAAAVLVTAVAVQAAPWREDAAPVAPSPTGTTEPTPDRTPTPTPTETVVADPSIVALTEDGALVLLDPATGETLAIVAQDPGFVAGSIAVDRSREVVYLTREQDPGSDTAGAEVVRVSLADGTVVALGPGWGPALSPDGTRLAYLGPPEGVTTYERFAERALVLLDLTSGERSWVPEGTGQSFMRSAEDPTWSADGARVLVGLNSAAEMGPGSSRLAVVDPQSPPVTLEAAQSLPTEGAAGGSPDRQYQQAFPLPDGRMVVEEIEITQVAAEDWTSRRNLVVLDGDQVEVRVGLPVTVTEEESASVYVVTVSPEPAGTRIAVVLRRWSWETDEVATSLWLWDGDQGFVELRGDVLAAAW